MVIEKSRNFLDRLNDKIEKYTGGPLSNSFHLGSKSNLDRMNQLRSCKSPYKSRLK
jgi:hypothetical protein